ncbi:MAG: RNA methyltransferase [Acidimicrobiales bacterium]
MVEGVVALRRLLELPGWEVRTIAVLPKVAERLAPLLEGRDEVCVVDEAALREVVGFDLHRGALASVQRRPMATLADVLATDPDPLLVAAEAVNDHENLGALYRNAAALGAAAVVLDDRCADPFYRRSVRVSSGNVLAVPTVAVPEGEPLVPWLRGHGLGTIALTPAGDVELDALPAATVRGATALVVGAEGPGLSPAALHAADVRASIEMGPGVDSLNVATAAAVALHRVRALRRLGQ